MSCSRQFGAAGPNDHRVDELERLDGQARAWADPAGRWLDEVGVGGDWATVDLGCGPRGILDLLGRRIGPGGRVVGVDHSPVNLLAARLSAATESWGDIELVGADVTATTLPLASFDLVHARFVCQETGVEPLLSHMIALASPGGVVAVEEPGPAPWSIDPTPAGFDELEPLVRALFLRRENADGPSLERHFHRAGLRGVQRRETRLTVRGGEPYAATPLHSLQAARASLIEREQVSAPRIAAATRLLQRAATDALYRHQTFSVTRVWAVKGPG